MARISPYLCKSWCAAQLYGWVAGGRKKQEWWRSSSPSALHGGKDFWAATWVHFQFHRHLVCHSLFLHVAADLFLCTVGVKCWHCPSSALCSVESCLWDSLTGVTGRFGIFGAGWKPPVPVSCWAATVGLWGTVEAGGLFLSEKQLWCATSFIPSLHNGALFLAFS